MQISKAMKCRSMLLKIMAKEKFYFINSDGLDLEKSGLLGIFSKFFRSLTFPSNI